VGCCGAGLHPVGEGPQGSLLLHGALQIATTTVTRFLWPSYENTLAPTISVQYQIPRTGTIRNLRVSHGIPAGNGNRVVYTLRVNGVATALFVAMASTAAVGSNLVDQIAVVAGDFIEIIVTKGLAIGASPVNITATMEYV
jgi:hypothetical protein